MSSNGGQPEVALPVGTRLGAYEITGSLGVGGMGEVYRATDTNLNRDVAIKILPPAFANDADRIARFQREAEALAALNHSNIAQIYGLERSGDTTAIAMELVEGPTLADRIAAGPMPIDEALGIAAQIADALEAAHEKNIVHRDLKPANIKLNSNGTVKVLDFGIATAPESRVATSGQPSPTLLTPALTEAGVLLGTAAYMSPEQARGRSIDQRADIWAFGCVLYEMLTGQPAFSGEDVTTTLARVLEREANSAALPASLPFPVRHTIELCLEKDPANRIADIRDVRLALQGRFETQPPRATHVTAARQPIWRRTLPVVVSVIVAAAVTSLIFLTTRPMPPTPKVRRSIHTIPADQSLNGAVPVIAISPDGNRIAYAAGGALQLRRLSELEGRPVPGTVGENPIVPVFSPDGAWILYGSNAGLKRVPAEGGTPLPVIPDSPTTGWRWDDDDMIRYVTGCQIRQVPSTGGTPELIVDESDGDCVEPTLLPGGDRLLFERRLPAGPEVDVFNLATGERTVLFPGKQPLYLEPGYITYFDPALGLMARQFDLDSLEFGGPVPMANDILTIGQTVHFRISPTGTLVYFKGTSATSGQSLMGIADGTGDIEQLDVPNRDFKNPSVSPVGDAVAVQIGNADTAQIFVYDLSGESELRQLTFEGGNQTPVWTPDGQWITYSSNRDGRWRIYRQRADGSGVAEALTDPAENTSHIEPAWMPNGEQLAYTETGDNGADIWIMSVPDGTPERLVGGDGNQTGIAFSPNGDAMTYSTSGLGGFEVLAEPYPPDGSRTRISEAGVPSAYPVWSRNGMHLSYQTASTAYMAIDLPAGGFAIRNRRTLPYNVPPDARRVDTMPGSDRMLLVVPPGQVRIDSEQREIVIVENWIEEVKQRIPMN
jgi:eukaryotic-like serine/threonine-protein kinase